MEHGWSYFQLKSNYIHSLIGVTAVRLIDQSDQTDNADNFILSMTGTTYTTLPSHPYYAQSKNRHAISRMFLSSLLHNHFHHDT